MTRFARTSEGPPVPFAPALGGPLSRFVRRFVVVRRHLTRVLLTVSLGLWLALQLAPVRARAEQPLYAYALVIGSNRGGDGQGTLAFAKRDAERVAELLGELGRVPREHIVRLEEPSRSDVERALGTLREKLSAHAAAGQRAQVLFYYSGHARAHALSLGDDELSLASLRASLLALPSALTVVVLDACQSGAFSGVKGAAPAADFSISSVHDLNSTGIAVMASSTGSELSQESSELGSSYFTHHLLVSLRGAGDLDHNGRVSLDEAYRYAYQHTLSDTARTQVGSQHATLEMEVTGRGDVPLSYPVDADAQLSLPADVEGRVLVQRSDGPVMAELVKARGGTLRLALPSGAYDVLVRTNDDAKSCTVSLLKGAVHPLSLASCRAVELPRENAKADRSLALRLQRLARESWFVELGPSLSFSPTDAYVKTLRDFGYDVKRSGAVAVNLTVGYQLHKHFSLVARYDMLENSNADRMLPRNNPRETALWWTGDALTLGGRLRLPLLSHWVVAFAEGDVGVSFARSSLDYSTTDATGALQRHTHDQRYRNLAVRGLAGFTFGFTRHFGMYGAGGFTYAPALHNDLGQHHNGGGPTFVTGLRLNGVKGWW